MFDFNSAALKLSALDQGMLEQTGVLRDNPKAPGPLALSCDAVALFICVAQAPPEGFAITRLPKALRSQWRALSLELELYNLVSRERNAQGQEAYLVLTWQGREALDQARFQSQTRPGWGARRHKSIIKATEPHWAEKPQPGLEEKKPSSKRGRLEE